MAILDADLAHRLPPGPVGAHRLLRHIRALRTDAPTLFEALRRGYGDTVRLPLGLLTATLVFHPDGIKHVLQDNNANYVRGIGYERFKIFMGDGLLTTDGPLWRERRRTINPMFHRMAIGEMVDTMASATAEAIGRWETLGPEGYAGDVVPEMMGVTLSAMGRIMFDTDLAADRERIGDAMDTAVRAMVFRGTMPELLPAWMPFPSNRRTVAARDVLHEVIDRIIAAHRDGSHGNRPDLVNLLLAEADSGGLDDVAVRDELMTIFMAGHETTATALAWTLFEVARDPEVQQRLFEEAQRVFGGSGEPHLADLAELTYTRMVLDEALRLHPPIWVFPRATVDDDDIAGSHVPAGECVFLSPYVTHRHPDLWDDPTRFDPERFTEAAKRERPRYTYFPFGGGQRKCVGESMALTQMTLTLAMMVSRFTFHALPGLGEELSTAVSLRPARGIGLRIVPRDA